MKSLNTLFSITLSAAALLAGGRPVLAQEVNTETLLHPPSDMWPGYHGDYTGQRHSKLSQITPENVDGLGLSWVFQTGQNALKSTPLVVNGVLYFTAPDNIWAVDARSGHEVWHYKYPTNAGLHIGHRGLGMYKDWLFFVTPDAHPAFFKR